MLALASCYCNDVYREANEKGIKIDRVEVEAEFVSKGEPAKNVTYGAEVKLMEIQARVVSRELGASSQ